jgi:cytoskeletal protein RodZ
MTIGVGDALRRMRESCGLSIEEAARDTRIRREFLEAIERDDFGLLLGDVHARGCLRTYASYLRLSPDKVVAAYATTLPDAAEPATVPTSTPPPRPRPILGRRLRDNHRLIVMIAATTLVLAAAFGVLSARQPAPPPAEAPSQASAIAPAPAAAGPITVAVLARRPVEVTIVADGGDPETFLLEVEEGRSFEAQSSITVRLSEGAAARITISGSDQGFPGEPGRPWQKTFEYASSSPTTG